MDGQSGRGIRTGNLDGNVRAFLGLRIGACMLSYGIITSTNNACNSPYLRILIISRLRCWARGYLGDAVG